MLRFAVLALAVIVPVVHAGTKSACYNGTELYLKGGVDQSCASWSSWMDSANSTGWGRFEVVTNANYPPHQQAYAAGFLEGMDTGDRMFEYWYNYRMAEYKDGVVPEKLMSFMSSQLAWIRSQVSSQSQDPYWVQMGLLMAQFDGLVAGHQLAPVNDSMSELEIYLLNSVGDLEDLNGLFTENDLSARPSPPARDLMLDCSGFIRLLDGGDIAVAHATWRDYYAMLRVYKVYRLSFCPPVSFSSSPGFLHSKDDFYAMQDLVTLETTNSVFNKTLYSYLTPASAFSWQRAAVSNCLAKGGRQWTDMFARYNSGTYNNQWMAVDMGLLRHHRRQRGQTSWPANDLLWIAEQIPTVVQTQDVTSVLLDQQYWGSYNIPYLQRVYNMSGYPAMADKYGDAFSYSKCPRAQIFRRNASVVDSVDHVQTLMRYNDYQHDPLSLGDPLNAVASRADLRASKAAAFGAVDAKVTSLSLLDDGFAVLAINGPTHQEQAPFSFLDKQWVNITRIGVADTFDFDWVTVRPSL